jgi:hypothetical protein
VRAPAPLITTTELPDGSVNYPYGPIKLECIEGQPPLTWSMVSDVNYIEDALDACGFAEVGTARGWHFDDGYAIYDLPFPFPFYGEVFSQVRVWSNGFLNFGPIVGSSYNNSNSNLIANARIAPLWDDLRTDCSGCDIYIDEAQADQVTIRWSGVTYTGSHPVNFSVTLGADGRVRFHYGSGNAPVTATVGMSAGDGQRYTLSQYNDLPSLPDANSLLLEQPNLLPPVMQTSADGYISGVPAEVGDFQPVFRVCDSLGRIDEAVVPLRVTEFSAGDCDFNGDSAIDLLDFAALQRCFTGADNGPIASECEVFRADPDADLDLADYEHFRLMFDN